MLTVDVVVHHEVEEDIQDSANADLVEQDNDAVDHKAAVAVAKLGAGPNTHLLEEKWGEAVPKDLHRDPSHGSHTPDIRTNHVWSHCAVYPWFAVQAPEDEVRDRVVHSRICDDAEANPTGLSANVLELYVKLLVYRSVPDVNQDHVLHEGSNLSAVVDTEDRANVHGPDEPRKAVQEDTCSHRVHVSQEDAIKPAVVHRDEKEDKRLTEADHVVYVLI